MSVDLIKNTQYKLIFFIIYLFSSISLIGQNDSDTVKLKEVTVEQDKKSQVTGFLSGNLKFHVEGVSGLPAMTGNTDLMKILELTPAARTSGDGNSNLYVRGGDPGQNLLQYNDVAIYGPGHILNIFPLFNADHLSSIELSKSGVNAQYGGFLSSVINVRSKNEIPNKNSIKGNVGLLASQATIDIAINKKWGAYVSGRKTYINFLLLSLINSMSKDKTNDIEYDFFDTNVTLIGQLSDCNKLTVEAILGEDKLKLNEEEILLDSYLKWQNIALSARLETSLSKNTYLEQNISYSNYENRLETSQSEMGLKLFSKVEDIAYKNKLSYYVGEVFVESGLQYHYRDILPQSTKMENAGIFHQGKTIERTIGHEISLYTTSILRPINKLYVEPGIRYTIFNSRMEGDEAKTFSNFDFRLSSRFQLNNTKFLRSSFSYNTQYINKLAPSSIGLPTDFWVMTTSSIRPQKGGEISGGYYQVLSDGKFELSGDLYYRHMNDVSEFNQNFLEYDNVLFTDKILYGRGKAYGMEVMLKKNIGRLTGWLSYALGRTERNVDGINEGEIYPAKYDRIHDFSGVVSYKFNNRWDASLIYIYATGNTYTQPSSWYFINNMPVKEYGKYNGARMPDYNRTDISVNYWFKKDNGLNFSIYNTFLVKNPVYIFMIVKNDKYTDETHLDVKPKTLFRIMPSISWNFKF